MMLIHSPSGWCLNFYVLKCAGTSPGTSQPGPDFYMEFRNTSLDKEQLKKKLESTSTFPLFAEFRDGQLILHVSR